MTSLAPATTRRARPVVPAPRAPSGAAVVDRDVDELARLQDVAAARSWATVDHRRPRRRG
ncbi:hypothetical protein WDZ17_10550 [Pseudokineococcus basanitobsidens]|uniref:Uncharacterized protein n=1 Tax=Pseudokineococcus basanitobsidens TaxID=1926649 RepID=A0ABU8RKV5_9ACTN